MKDLYLGVDGGGTSTNAIIVDNKDQVIGEGISGPGNYRAVGLFVANNNILTSVLQAVYDAKNKGHLTKDAEIKFKAVGVGLASVDTKEELKTLSKTLNDQLGRYSDNIKLVNDAVTALYSGSTSEDAICIVSGTGSNCYGRNSKGKKIRIGGLDWLMSDEGSGYALGRAALRAATKSEDGRIKTTLLEQLIMHKLEVKNIREVKNHVYRADFSKDRIAAFANLVIDAERAGDWKAKVIIEHAISELMLMIQTGVQRLKFSDQPFDLVATGGMFKHQIYKSSIKKLFTEQFPNGNLIYPEKHPVWGAIVLAKQENL